MYKRQVLYAVLTDKQGRARIINTAWLKPEEGNGKELRFILRLSLIHIFWPLNTVVAPAASPPAFSNAQLDWGKRGSEKNSFYTGCYLCISPAGTRG